MEKGLTIPLKDFFSFEIDDYVSHREFFDLLPI